MVSALKTRYARHARVVLAFVLSLSLAFPPLGPLLLPKAHAGPLSNYKVLINNSQASATGVTYTLQWTVSDPQAIKQIDTQFCTTPSGTCTAPTGMSTSGASLGANNVSGTTVTGSAPAANSLRVSVGTPATQDPTTMSITFTGITNPSTADTTFYARTTTYSDTGTTIIDGTTVTAFAILTSSSIAVTATVDTSFTFSVAAVASGGNLNGGTGNIDETSTATTIPFGTLTTGTDEIVAHDLTISTNAANGYQVTASHAATLISGNPPLASGSANIDTFTSDNTSPAAWSEPNGTTANSNTGFFGYTTEDSTLCTGTADRFTNGGPKWAGTSLVGAEIACSSTPDTGTSAIRVGWAVEVNGYQPPGLYQGTVILIATPTY